MITNLLNIVVSESIGFTGPHPIVNLHPIEINFNSQGEWWNHVVTQGLRALRDISLVDSCIVDVIVSKYD